jgi:DNA-binding NarL/FixJ family response regulator
VRTVGCTQREYDVVTRLLRYGWTNAEIARDLWLTEDTVKTHMKRLAVRTGVRSRTELVVAIFRGRIRLVPAAVPGGHAGGVTWSASKEPIAL